MIAADIRQAACLDKCNQIVSTVLVAIKLAETMLFPGVENR